MCTIGPECKIKNFRPEGCVVSKNGELCGETDTLEITKEFKRCYEEKLRMIEKDKGPDFLQDKLKLQKEWIDDLYEQNEMLVKAVQELEYEASERVLALEEKLQQSAKCICEVMKKYREHDVASDLLSEPLQRIFELENDQKNLLELLRRGRCKNDWSLDGLKFFTINKCDLFKDKTRARSRSRSESKRRHSTGRRSSSLKRKEAEEQLEKTCCELDEKNKELEKKERIVVELEQKIKHYSSLGNVETIYSELTQIRTEYECYRRQTEDMRHALAEEVASKHDVILALKRDCYQLEERCLQADKQVAFKDDIIKELRKEIKQLKQQLDQVPVDCPKSKAISTSTSNSAGQETQTDDTVNNNEPPTLIQKKSVLNMETSCSDLDLAEKRRQEQLLKQNDCIQKECNDLKLKIQEMECELENSQNKNECQINECAEIRQKIEQLRVELSREKECKEKETCELKKIIEELQTKIQTTDRFAHEKDCSQKEITNLKNRIKELECQMQSSENILKENACKGKECLEYKIKIRELEIDNLNLQDIRSERDCKVKECLELKRCIWESQCEIENQKEVLKQKECSVQECHQLRNRIKQMDQELITAQDLLTDRELKIKEVNDLRNKIWEMQYELDCTKEQMKEKEQSERECCQLRQRIHHLELELQNSTQLLEGNECKLKECSDLKNKIWELQCELENTEQLRKDKDCLSKECNELKNKLFKLECEYETSQGIISANECKTNECNQLRTKVWELESQLQNQQDLIKERDCKVKEYADMKNKLRQIEYELQNARETIKANECKLNECAQLKNRIWQLETELENQEELKKTKECRTRECSEMRIKIKQLESNLQLSKEVSCESLCRSKEFSVLKGRIFELEQELDSLRQLRAEKDCKIRECLELKNKIRQQECELKEKESSIIECAQLRNKVMELEMEQNADHICNRKNCLDLANKIKEMEHEIYSLQKGNDCRVKECNDLKNRIRELQSELQNSQERGTNLQLAVDIHLNSINVLEATEEKYRLEIDQQKVTIANLQDALVSSKNNLEELKQKSDDSIQEQKSIFNILYGFLVNTEEQKSIINKQYEEIIENYSNLQELNLELETEHCQTLQDIEEMEIQLHKYHDILVENKKENSTFRTYIDSLILQKDHYEKVVEYFKKEMRLMSEQLLSLQSLLTASTETAESENNKLQHSLNDVKETNKKLNCKLVAVEQQMRLENQMNQINESKIQDLQKIVSSQDMCNSHYQEITKVIKSNLQVMFDQNQELKGTIRSLNESISDLSLTAKKNEHENSQSKVCTQNCREQVGKCTKNLLELKKIIGDKECELKKCQECCHQLCLDHQAATDDLERANSLIQSRDFKLSKMEKCFKELYDNHQLTVSELETTKCDLDKMKCNYDALQDYFHKLYEKHQQLTDELEKSKTTISLSPCKAKEESSGYCSSYDDRFKLNDSEDELTLKCLEEVNTQTTPRCEEDLEELKKSIKDKDIELYELRNNCDQKNCELQRIIEQKDNQLQRLKECLNDLRKELQIALVRPLKDKKEECVSNKNHKTKLVSFDDDPSCKPNCQYNKPPVKLSNISVQESESFIDETQKIIKDKTIETNIHLQRCLQNMNNKLIDTIDELEKTKKDMSNKQLSLCTGTGISKNTIDDMKTTIKTYKEEIAELQCTLNQVNAKLAKATEELCEKQHTIECLQKESQTWCENQDEIAEQQRVIKELQCKLDEVRAKEDLICSMQKIMAELKQKADVVQTKDEEICKLQATIKDLNTELTSFAECNNKMAMEISNSKVQGEVLFKKEQEINRYRKIIKDLRHTMFQLDELNRGLGVKEMCKCSDEQQSTCSRELQPVIEMPCEECDDPDIPCPCEVEFYKNVVETLGSNVVELKKKLTECQAKLKTSEIYNKQKIEDMQQTCQRKDKELNELRNKLTERLQVYQCGEEKYKELNRKLDGEIMHLKQELDCRNHKLAEVKKSVKEINSSRCIQLACAQDEIVLLKNEIGRVMKKQSQLNVENEQLTQQVNCLQATVTSLQEQNNLLKNQLEQYLQELSTIQKEKDDLMRKKVEVLNELRTLQGSYAQITKQQRYTADSVKNLEAEIDVLKTNRDEISYESKNVVSYVKAWLEEQRKINDFVGRKERNYCEIIEKLQETECSQSMEKRPSLRKMERILTPQMPPQMHRPPPPQSPWSLGSQGTASCFDERDLQSPSIETEWYSTNYQCDSEYESEEDSWTAKVENLAAQVRQTNSVWKNKMKCQCDKHVTRDVKK
ncbi:unnamed protein product [Brassicogethes aeneus]|uniref:Uncharacterized protein n=1 Tax=Brassicogethes aeneus TaxID=1431903 RepID=A0A9P0FHC2_BRAAE|nr:unnamed protein product [Brassicogethes aeneus]